ncbi:hypothetical protein C8Q80DRAFT_956302 [Daedaleopsis nitida]|nr:hypothetical protein C8Q80DRAFT_956302 [Daedaleopsis nitida]
MCARRAPQPQPHLLILLFVSCISGFAFAFEFDKLGLRTDRLADRARCTSLSAHMCMWLKRDTLDTLTLLQNSEREFDDDGHDRESGRPLPARPVDAPKPADTQTMLRPRVPSPESRVLMHWHSKTQLDARTGSEPTSLASVSVLPSTLNTQHPRTPEKTCARVRAPPRTYIHSTTRAKSEANRGRAGGQAARSRGGARVSPLPSPPRTRTLLINVSTGRLRSRALWIPLGTSSEAPR